jgi:hypothetical protein
LKQSWAELRPDAQKKGSLKITEGDRAAVRAAEDQKPKMSQRAKDALRDMNEHAKEDRLAEERFIAAFERLPQNVPAMRYVLRKVFPECGDQCALTRMAMKLIACLASGLRPACVHDVAFLAELTAAEFEMSEAAFEAELAKHSAKRYRPKISTAKRCRPSRMARLRVWHHENTHPQPLCFQ